MLAGLGPVDFINRCKAAQAASNPRQPRTVLTPSPRRKQPNPRPRRTEPSGVTGIRGIEDEADDGTKVRVERPNDKDDSSPPSKKKDDQAGDEQDASTTSNSKTSPPARKPKPPPPKKKSKYEYKDKDYCPDGALCFDDTEEQVRIQDEAAGDFRDQGHAKRPLGPYMGIDYSFRGLSEEEKEEAIRHFWVEQDTAKYKGGPEEPDDRGAVEPDALWARTLGALIRPTDPAWGWDSADADLPIEEVLRLAFGAAPIFPTEESFFASNRGEIDPDDVLTEGQRFQTGGGPQVAASTRGAARTTEGEPTRGRRSPSGARELPDE